MIYILSLCVHFVFTGFIRCQGIFDMHLLLQKLSLHQKKKNRAHRMAPCAEYYFLFTFPQDFQWNWTTWTGMRSFDICCRIYSLHLDMFCVSMHHLIRSIVFKIGSLQCKMSFKYFYQRTLFIVVQISYEPSFIYETFNLLLLVFFSPISCKSNWQNLNMRRKKPI